MLSQKKNPDEKNIMLIKYIFQNFGKFLMDLYSSTPTLRPDKHRTLWFDDCDDIVQFVMTSPWQF